MSAKTKARDYNPAFLAGGLWHPRRRIPRILCGLTLALLAISALAHFATYLGFNFSIQFPWLWLGLQLSYLIHLIIPVVYRRHPLFKGPAAYVKEPQLPTYLMILLTCFFLFYAMINFGYYYWVMRYGYPEEVGGQLLLILPHGQKPLQLSATQFSVYEFYQARKVSGHWMLCHLLPLMGYYDWLTDRAA
jgi:hypothetical protein